MRYPPYKYFYAISDFIILTLSFFFAKSLYYLINSKPQYLIYQIDTQDLILLFLSNLMFVLLFHYYKLYKQNIFLTRARHSLLILKSLFYGIIIILVASFFVKFDILTDSRLTIIIYFIISLLLFVLIRVLILQKLYKKILSKTFFKMRILVIGAGKSGQLFAQKITIEDMMGAEIIGFVDDEISSGTTVFNGLKVLGRTRDLNILYSNYQFDEVVICIDRIDYENLMKIIDESKKLDISVKVSSELFGIIPEKIFTENYANVPVTDVSAKVNIRSYLLFKRLSDIIGASLGILFLTPFFLITSIIIKLTSPGPIIFKQKRIGKNGKSFNFYKFRSMKIIEGEDDKRAEKMIEFMKSGDKNIAEKIVDDSRITRIGSFLRKYSLDELPQLFNVIVGDMSLVGPRPCLPYEYENYDEWQKRRLSVLPGCTGLWQVSGRSQVGFNDSVIMDIYYINNITPWFDLLLILKTIPVMVFAKGGK